MRRRLFLFLLASPTLRPLVRLFSVRLASAQDVRLVPQLSDTATIATVDVRYTHVVPWTPGIGLALVNASTVRVTVPPDYVGPPVRFSVFEFAPPDRGLRGDPVAHVSTPDQPRD